MPRPIKSHLINPRLIKTAIAAGIGALLVAGCTSIPSQATPDGAMHDAMASRMTGGMAGDQQCMMMAQHDAKGDEAAAHQMKPMACKMDCNCPMMQMHGAADAPSAPSLAPPEQDQHSPDVPAAEH